MKNDIKWSHGFGIFSIFNFFMGSRIGQIIEDVLKDLGGKTEC